MTPRIVGTIHKAKSKAPVRDTGSGYSGKAGRWAVTTKFLRQFRTSPVEDFQSGFQLPGLLGDVSQLLLDMLPIYQKAVAGSAADNPLGERDREDHHILADRLGLRAAAEKPVACAIPSHVNVRLLEYQPS